MRAVTRPSNGRNDFGVGKIQFGLVQFRLGLLDGGVGGFDRRLAQGHLRFGGFDLAARRLQIGGGGSRLGLRQINRAFGHGPAFNRFITLEIVVRPLSFRFGGDHRRLRLRDLGFADLDLRLGLIRLAAAPPPDRLWPGTGSLRNRAGQFPPARRPPSPPDCP